MVAADTTDLKEHFLLNPEVAFFNHGSFGACPRPVFEEYQRLQRQMEWLPTDFLGRNRVQMVDEARAALAEYVKTDVGNIVFVPNATSGINTVARSLAFEAGDEILTTNHEYGAINNTWKYICEKTGAQLLPHHIDLPVTTHEAFVDSFWSEVTPRTRLISISHVTSPTSLIFPIEEICRRAREVGIITVIDGAHAPSQIDLDMEAIGADFYSGNCHKWLSAPKGSGFLYARPKHHPLIDPLVISHGRQPDSTFATRSEWQGTRDISAFLTVPAAIEFQKEHNWPGVRQRCHELAIEVSDRVSAMTRIEPIATDLDLWFSQMISIPLPDQRLHEVATRLYEDYNTVIAGGVIDEQHFMRISVQAYNTQDDIDRLCDAMAEIL